MLSQLSAMKKNVRFTDSICSNLKSVRFAENLCSAFGGAVLDIHGVVESELWYPINHTERVKRRVTKLSEDARSNQLSLLLMNTYSKSDEKTIQAINTWALLCENRRGIERLVNRRHGVLRSDAQSRTVKAILTAQQKMRKDGDQVEDLVSDKMGKLSETFSNDSVQFARLMGNADALVVKKQENIIDCANFACDDSQKILPNRVYVRDAVTMPNNDSTLLNKKKHLKSLISVASRDRFIHSKIERGSYGMQHFY